MTKSAFEEQLALKKRQLEDYQKSKPEEIVKPADQLDEDQVAASAVLEEAAGAPALIDEERRNSSAKISMLAARSKAAQNVREHLRMIQRSYEQFKVDTEADLEVLGVPLDSVLKFGVSLAPVEGGDSCNCRRAGFRKGGVGPSGRTKGCASRAASRRKSQAKRAATSLSTLPSDSGRLESKAGRASWFCRISGYSSRSRGSHCADRPAPGSVEGEAIAAELTCR